MDAFLLRALVAGSVVAIVAGPVGALMIWRRMAYFGSAVSHSALLGIAVGLLLGIGPMAGVLLFCIGVALMLTVLQRGSALPSDSLIGLLAHVALAAGLIALSLVHGLRVDLIGYLFGDVLAVSWRDLWIIGPVSAAVVAIVIAVWRPLLSLTLHEDLARVEGIPTRALDALFMVLVAVVVAVGMRVVGILLIVSMLIIPAAAARRMSSSPEQMALFAIAIGLVSVWAGIGAAFTLDLQAGPAIVLVAGAVFAASYALRRARRPSAHEQHAPRQ